MGCCRSQSPKVARKFTFILATRDMSISQQVVCLCYWLENVNFSFQNRVAHWMESLPLAKLLCISTPALSRKVTLLDSSSVRDSHNSLLLPYCKRRESSSLSILVDTLKLWCSTRRYSRDQKTHVWQGKQILEIRSMGIVKI